MQSPQDIDGAEPVSRAVCGRLGKIAYGCVSFPDGDGQPLPAKAAGRSQSRRPHPVGPVRATVNVDRVRPVGLRPPRLGARSTSSSSTTSTGPLLRPQWGLVLERVVVDRTSVDVDVQVGVVPGAFEKRGSEKALALAGAGALAHVPGGAPARARARVAATCGASRRPQAPPSQSSAWAGALAHVPSGAPARPRPGTEAQPAPGHGWQQLAGRARGQTRPGPPPRPSRERDPGVSPGPSWLHLPSALQNREVGPIRLVVASRPSGFARG